VTRFLIYWRSTPYKEKWVICRQGTQAAPITVRGVPGPAGELPVIDGNGATTRSALNYWNETRAVIKIGGANVPADTLPKFITLENLDIRSARPPYTFVAANGSTQAYANNASSIYVEKGENITVRNCIIHDSGNGFFVASSDALASRNILVEGELHPRQRKQWQHLRTQHLYRRDRHRVSIQPLWPVAGRVFRQQPERSIGWPGGALQLD
jgi:hypothetical protein